MRLLIFSLSLLFSLPSTGQQKLKAGFDKSEYLELLSLAFYSSIKTDSMPGHQVRHQYKMEYRSEEVGLLNRWTLYLRDDQLGIIDIRGTVNKSASWLANFYAAMIPATGTLQLNDSTKFNYQLASDPRAAVHVGWTVALGFLGPDILQKLKAYYSSHQIKEYILFGHSQGGGISFLVRSYLEYEKQQGRLPADLVIKTYSSAAPKPGNMYYAYDYDFITRNGWGFTIVNAMDWVPETPFSIQQMNDLNQPNPLTNFSTIIGKQKFYVKLAGKSIYGKLERKPRKAQRKYEKYLGHAVYKHGIKKTLPQFKEPEYLHTANVMRAGVPIVLIPDKTYGEKFSSARSGFGHHVFAPYYYLVSRYY